MAEVAANTHFSGAAQPVRRIAMEYGPAAAAVAVAAVLRFALALVGTKDRGVRVRFDLAPRVDFVFADKVQIQGVLLNLIRNAIEAMDGCERAVAKEDVGDAI